MKVVREYSPVPPIVCERPKVLQILRMRVESGAPDHVRLMVSDKGVGISPETLARIFNHGFTTRKDGHGFGLHWSALAAKQMKGSLKVESRGLHQGATFTLELPLSSTTPNSSTLNNSDGL